MSKTIYAIAIGSNQPLKRGMGPTALVRAAIEALDHKPLHLKAVSPIIGSAAMGPSRRRYANAAVLVRTKLDPPALLAQLHAIEHRFGRRRAQRWGARTLDLDILFWSEGMWSDPHLTVPHVGLRLRPFVLQPLAAIAPDWRDPLTGLKVKHLRARLDRPRPRH